MSRVSTVRYMPVAESLLGWVQGLLVAFVNFIKERKTVALEDLAAEFGLRVQVCCCYHLISVFYFALETPLMMHTTQ